MINLTKKLLTLSIMFIILMNGFHNYSYANDKITDEANYVVDLNNAKCPVSNENVKKDFYSIHDGNMYHFCCNSCMLKFKKNPQKYIKSFKPDLHEKQTKYEMVNNTKCPMTENAVDKNIFAVKDSKVYYFCCKNCMEKFTDYKQNQTYTAPPKFENSHDSHSSNRGCKCCCY